MAKTYRKKNGPRYTWHFCRNCSNWPTSDYTERSSRPPGDLCDECKSKEKENNCS